MSRLKRGEQAWEEGQTQTNEHKHILDRSSWLVRTYHPSEKFIQNTSSHGRQPRVHAEGKLTLIVSPPSSSSLKGLTSTGLLCCFPIRRFPTGSSYSTRPEIEGTVANDCGRVFSQGSLRNPEGSLTEPWLPVNNYPQACRQLSL